MAEPSSQHRSGPSGLIRGSVAWHAAAAAVTLVRPHWWRWSLCAVVADHLLLTAADDRPPRRDRKSTRLNSSHSQISYAVFCLKKKKKFQSTTNTSTPPAA